MKKFAKYISIFIISSLLLGLTACSSCTYTQATLPQGVTIQPIKPTPQTNSGYNVIKTLRARRYGNLLHANVEIESTSDRDRQIGYQFMWLDKEGFIVGNSQVWQPFTLYSGITRQISGVAPNPSAVTYQIRICTK